MSLARYFAKLRAGDPINYEAFLGCLPRDVAARHRQYFAVEKVGKQRWRVRCLDEDVLAALEQAAERPEDRLAAARLGDSHRHVTDACVLLVYCEGLPDCRPAVVFLSEASCLQSFAAKRTALVVENEQNFLRPDVMLHLASRFTGRRLGQDNTDVVLGGGNRITRELSAAWLDQYAEVVCAFDYDRGGLTMFSTLRKRLGGKVEYMQPADWTPYLPMFKKTPKSEERALQALELAESHGFYALARAFKETERFMEQELLLELPDAQ
jgi:hypothetical protein